MGVFSVSSSYGIDTDFDGYIDDVEMNEAYTTGVDMSIALSECRQNEFAVLQAGIKQDMVAALTEDYEERIAINEATASEVINKVKEILKKLLEKIKSIFHAFMAKINAFFSDGETMFKKYSPDIAKKNFTDFKLKVRKFNMANFTGLLKTGKVTFNTSSSSVMTPSGGVSVFDSEDKTSEAMTNEELVKSIKPVIFSANALNTIDIDDNLGNMEKEIEDYCFDDAEVKDDFTSTAILTLDWIGGLLNKKKFIENIEKSNKSTETQIAKIINTLDKNTEKIAGTVGKKGAEYTANKAVLNNRSGIDGTKASATYSKSSELSVGSGDNPDTKIIKLRKATYLQAWASKYQTMTIKAQNARLSCAKKAMAQAKKIFAAAVAYNPKKENFDFYTAVAESEEFDAIMAME